VRAGLVEQGEVQLEETQVEAHRYHSEHQSTYLTRMSSMKKLGKNKPRNIL
jgi:hypothetical protein